MTAYGDDQFRYTIAQYASMVYCKLLLVMCFSYLLSEVLVTEIQIYYFEGFFTYLYGGAIAFIIYVHVYLRRFSCYQNENSDKITRNHKSHGSFIVRLGVVIFGLGSIAFSVAELVMSVEVSNMVHCTGDKLRNVNSVLGMLFTLMQMVFIWYNPRLNIHSNRVIGWFGTMHLLATNLCVWFQVLVQESMHEIHEYEHVAHTYNLTGEAAAVHPTAATPHDDPMGGHKCHRTQTPMGKSLSSSVPYLLPLVIEYCLITSTVTYVMWHHIRKLDNGKIQDQSIEGNNEMVQILDNEERYRGMDIRRRMNIDFVGVMKGFGFGIVTLLVYITALVVSFTTHFENRGVERDNYIFIIGSVALVIYIVNIVVIGFGFGKIKELEEEHDHNHGEDEVSDILLPSSAFGWNLYCMFLILSVKVVNDASNIFTAIVNIFNIIEVTMHLFLMKVLHGKRIKGVDQEEKRPGRQIVTYLFFSSFTLWLMYTFVVSNVFANSAQIKVFGVVSWAILLRITLPLGIFFRFHACVHYGEAWKNVYQLKKPSAKVNVSNGHQS